MCETTDELRWVIATYLNMSLFNFSSAQRPAQKMSLFGKSAYAHWMRVALIN
jgi:hypothetical protein